MKSSCIRKNMIPFSNTICVVSNHDSDNWLTYCNSIRSRKSWFLYLSFLMVRAVEVLFHWLNAGRRCLLRRRPSYWRRKGFCKYSNSEYLSILTANQWAVPSFANFSAAFEFPWTWYLGRQDGHFGHLLPMSWIQSTTMIRKDFICQISLHILEIYGPLKRFLVQVNVYHSMNCQKVSLHLIACQDVKLHE